MLYQSLPASVDLLERFCLISSGSTNPAGNRAVQSLLADYLELLGFEVCYHKQKGGELELLEARYRGGARFHKSFVSLVCHSDTLDNPTKKSGEFRVSGDRAIGQGVLDDKSGLVVILKGLEGYLASNPTSKHSLRVICSPNEELGSVGFHELYQKFSKDTAVVLGFEPALPTGNFVNERAGNVWYDVKIEGKEAHSGRAPFEGVNAAFEFAHKAEHLQKLNSQKRGVSVQIGSVRSTKDLFNVVCGEVSFKIDFRFRNPEDEKRIGEQIETILKKSFVKKSRCTFRVADRCPAMPKSPKAKGIEKLYAKFAQSRGQATGGSADAAHLCKKGVVALDGLGAVGNNMHQHNEFVDLKSIDKRAKALTQLLRHL